MKQTEIGLIPDDWEVKELEEICDTSSGGTPSRSNTNFFHGDIKWFTTTELKDCFLYDSIEHISKSAINSSSAKLYPENTLLMAMYGATIGRLGVLKNVAATNQACCAIFPKTTDVMYLFYYLLFKRDEIVAFGSGAGQPNISQNIVRKLLITLPPLAEQQRIAKALSDVDALISTTERLIQKKKNIKQGTMQNLLTGKKRLPGFVPQTKSQVFKQTELGPIPEDWEVKSLGEIANFQGGSQPDISFFSNIKKKNYIRLIQIRDYKTDKYATYIPISLARRFCSKDDIMIGRYGPPIFQILRGLEGAYNVALIKTEPHNVFKEFYYYVLNDYKLFSFIELLSRRSSGQTGVDLLELKKYKIPFPPSKEEQTAIANVLSNMDKEIETLNTKLEKYRNLKTAMMQQLLTGKIRLV